MSTKLDPINLFPKFLSDAEKSESFALCLKIPKTEFEKLIIICNLIVKNELKEKTGPRFKIDAWVPLKAPYHKPVIFASDQYCKNNTPVGKYGNDESCSFEERWRPKDSDGSLSSSEVSEKQQGSIENLAFNTFKLWDNNPVNILVEYICADANGLAVLFRLDPSAEAKSQIQTTEEAYFPLTLSVAPGQNIWYSNHFLQKYYRNIVNKKPSLLSREIDLIRKNPTPIMVSTIASLEYDTLWSFDGGFMDISPIGLFPLVTDIECLKNKAEQASTKKAKKKSLFFFTSSDEENDIKLEKLNRTASVSGSGNGSSGRESWNRSGAEDRNSNNNNSNPRASYQMGLSNNETFFDPFEFTERVPKTSLFVSSQGKKAIDACKKNDLHALSKLPYSVIETVDSKGMTLLHHSVQVCDCSFIFNLNK